MLFFSLAMVYTNAMPAFHWPRLTSRQCLFFIGYGLHPRYACFSLGIVYTNAMLAFHWPRLTSTQWLFPESPRWFYLRPDLALNNIRWVHRDLLQPHSWLVPRFQADEPLFEWSEGGVWRLYCILIFNFHFIVVYLICFYMWLRVLTIRKVANLYQWG